MGDTVTPQGIVAIVARGTGSPVDLPASPRLVAVLDRCSDPGNAGTAIRTATAAGADAVVVSAGSVDIWSGKCVRASAGSVFQIPVLTEMSSVRAIAALRAAGCEVLATAADGEPDLDTLADAGALAAPTAWLFGNEAHGLSDELRAAVDRTVRVPLYGPAESLNLAACVAVCLYASARAQRRR
jgi:TrmH family RNA methyltransferase